MDPVTINKKREDDSDVRQIQCGSGDVENGDHSFSGTNANAHERATKGYNQPDRVDGRVGDSINLIPEASFVNIQPSSQRGLRSYLDSGKASSRAKA
jgi:hypothetical protein